MSKKEIRQLRKEIREIKKRITGIDYKTGRGTIITGSTKFIGSTLFKPSTNNNNPTNLLLFDNNNKVKYTSNNNTIKLTDNGLKIISNLNNNPSTISLGSSILEISDPNSGKVSMGIQK